MLIFGAFVAAAEDSYLYWMVGDAANDLTYNKVKIKADGATYLQIWDSDSSANYNLGDSVTRQQASNYEAINGGLFAYLGSNPTYSSFVIELYNDSAFIAQSDSLSMSEALASYITQNNSMANLSAAWAPVSFAVPEPNSAMLILIGCAALGLRRRRRLVA